MKTPDRLTPLTIRFRLALADGALERPPYGIHIQP
jgi:hypothetical protein